MPSIGRSKGYRPNWPDIKERYAVDLVTGREARFDSHHPTRHVAVKLEVGEDRNKACRALEMSYLEPWLGHLDAERLGLIAARNTRAVIRREHDDRPGDQTGLEHAFATDVQVVRIYRARTSSAQTKRSGWRGSAHVVNPVLEDMAAVRRGRIHEP